MVRMPVPSRIGPTSTQTRIRSIDAVRGFALFGVLLVNMFNFGAYSPEWTGTADQAFSATMHLLFETKSLRLFSLLFGFGFALQMVRVASLDDGSIGFYFRRLFFLFLFGMAHALFYDGDILMEYAILGLVLVLFSKVPNLVLLALACLLLAAFPVGNLVHSPGEEEVAMQLEDEWPLEVLRAGHPYLGSVMDVFEENIAAIPPQIWSGLHQPESSLTIFAMLLLGFFIGRSRIIHEKESNIFLLKRVCYWGLGTGIAAAVLEWWLSRQFGYSVYLVNQSTERVRVLGDALFACGSTAMALGYGAGIVLLARRQEWQVVLKPLTNAGRMALTVYLSGTLMFTLLFYGWGFGQLYRLGPAATTAFAVLFFAVQLMFCNWWLQRFRFGPAEWLWRSLTYLKFQPMRLNRP
ncbi:DUF418 domain-containing protein [Pseudomonadota bacterium]